MKTSKTSFIVLSGVILILLACISASAQQGFKSRSGMKWPDKVPACASLTTGMGILSGDLFSGSRHFRDDHPEPRSAVRPDSMISFSEYEGYTIKKIYTYSPKGNLETLLTKVFADDLWVDYDRSSYICDRKGNVLSETVAYWDGVEWITYLTLEYTYNKKGWCTSLLYHDVFGDFTELVTMFYDHRGNRIRELGRYWDGEAYVNLELWIYVYDQRGDRVRTLGRMWDGTAWADYKRETWTYLSKGKWLTDMVEYADPSGWLKYTLYESAYNTRGYRESYTGSYWYEEIGWNVEVGGRFTYDPHGNMVSNVQSYYAWWESSPFWVPTDSTATDFNYFAKTVTGTGYVHTGEEWIRGETNIYIPFNDRGTILVFADEYPSNEVEVFYSCRHPHHDAAEDESDMIAQSPANPAKTEFSLSASPNPFTEGFMVFLNAPVAEPFVITLLDGQGKTIREVFNGELGAGEHQMHVGSLSGLAGGLMFLRAVSPGHSATVKMIKP